MLNWFSNKKKKEFNENIYAFDELSFKLKDGERLASVLLEAGDDNIVEIYNTSGVKSKDIDKLIEQRPYIKTKVRVFGGYTNKFMNTLRKPNESRYRQIATYSVQELRDIVAGMEKIEKHVDPNWTKSQKAMYLFGVLKDVFPYDKRGEKPTNERDPQYSNLQPLSFDEGCGAVSLGYALMYKELCDRQGIECEMIGGELKRGMGSRSHVWNIINVDDKKYLVDIQQANASMSYINVGGNYISNGKTNYDYFAYTGDKSNTYRPAGEKANYERLGCVPGMVKHLMEKSVEKNVAECVESVSNHWLEATNDGADM